jgi:hypothetical protein
MLVISQDGPLALDRLEVRVESSGKTLLAGEYRVPDETELPTSLALVSNGDETAQAIVSVTAWKGTHAKDAVPLDRRDAIVTQIPKDRVALLRVVLSGRCSQSVELVNGEAKSTCADAKTCNPSTGACTTAIEVNATTLADYQPGDETHSVALDAGPASASSEATTGASQSGVSSELTTAPSASFEASASSDAGANAVSDAGVAKDPCLGVVCDEPPKNGCSGGSSYSAYNAQGECSAGKCEYSFNAIGCFCEDDECTTDPCLEVTCKTSPKATCKNDTTLTTFAAAGTCSRGSCSYESSDQPCAACKDGACSSARARTSVNLVKPVRLVRYPTPPSALRTRLAWSAKWRTARARPRKTEPASGFRGRGSLART